MGSNEKQPLVIRADANPQIGAGHIMRCTALAQAWQLAGGRAIILSHCIGDSLRQQITDAGIQCLPVTSPYPDRHDLEITLEVLGKYSADVQNHAWLVLDGYHFVPEYQQAIRSAGYHLLVIDDMAHFPIYHADVVLNQNLGAEKLKYNCDSDTTLLLGSRYALLRQEFAAWQQWKRETPEVAHKVLVTMGNSDPIGVTLKVIQALKQVHWDGLETIVVVGGSNPHYEILESEIQNSPFKIRLEHNVTMMSELMAWADIAITASGSTCWELAFMGVPSLVIGTADNQSGVLDQLDRSGLAVKLGWHDQVTASQIAHSCVEVLKSPRLRESLSQRCRTSVDGEGVDRVLMYMNGNDIRLRRVKESDKSLLWQWANMPEVRSASFSTSIIPWEEHIQWFASKLKDPNCFFYLALNNMDESLGQVRFDIDGAESVISVSLDAKYRGRGYGSQLIMLATQKLFQTSDVQLVHAYIKEENLASIRAFLKAGFLEDKMDFVHGQQARHLILTSLRKA